MDLFKKCVDYTMPDDYKAMGIYPYFHELQSRQDVEVIMVVSSSATLDATSSSECDAIMFIGLDYKHQKIKLVPVMRDLYVRIGGYHCERQKNWRRRPEKSREASYKSRAFRVRKA